MTLTIPDIDPDADTLTAALAYAKHGWYVVPIRRSTKHPGSILGDGWQRQSSRDPEQLVAWFAGSGDGVALHCGRSGAVVLDIDNPDAIPDIMRPHLHAAPSQSTRPEQPERRHVLYLMPPGRRIGNGMGKLRGAWGDVRGVNGIIVVAPSVHPEGGEYRWRKTGPVPMLPTEIADMLPDTGDADADAATDEQVTTFIKQHTEASHPGLLGAAITQFRERLASGESRHNSAASILAWAMDEAAGGVYTAQHADTELSAIFLASKTDTDSAHGRELRTLGAAKREWAGIRAWAVGRTLAKTPEQITEVAKRAANTPDIFAVHITTVAGETRTIDMSRGEMTDRGMAERCARLNLHEVGA